MQSLQSIMPKVLHKRGLHIQASASLITFAAQRIGDRVQHDASSGTLPEEVAAAWGEGWLALAKESAAAGVG